MKIKIIDSFLNKKDLKKIILCLKKTPVKKDDISIYKINNKTLVNTLNKNYHNIAISILKKIAPKKINLFDYSQFVIVETGPDFKFPIHDDDPNKILSGVIYLKPKKNSGTIFYSSKRGANKKIIKWKQNRAVFFSRIERESWHSYQGDGKNNRITLVYNLMTNRVNQVFKLERKNYFFGMIRWKLNPFIYRFFKRII